MEWAVIQFNNRVDAILDDATAICSLFAIFILASNFIQLIFLKNIVKKIVINFNINNSYHIDININL